MKSVVACVCAFVAIVASLPPRGVEFTGSIAISTPVNLQPEGFDFSYYHGTFILSSLTDGKLYTLSSIDSGLNGVLTQFASPPSGISSLVGVQVDCDRELVYVASLGAVFPSPTPIGGVSMYSETDGDFLEFFNFTDLYDTSLPKLVNDVVSDRYGHIYATDSFNGNIYTANPFTKKVELLLHTSLLEPVSGSSIGVNGIEYFTVNGYNQFLLVVTSGPTPDTSKIYRVPIDSPYEMLVVPISNPYNFPLPYSYDGCKISPQTETSLYVVGAFSNLVYEFYSDDYWVTCSLVSVKNVTVRTTGPASISIDAYDNQIYVNSNIFTSGPYYIEAINGFSSRPVEELECSGAAHFIASVGALAVVVLVAVL